MCIHADKVRRIHGEFDPLHHTVKDTIAFAFGSELVTAKLVKVEPHYILYREVAARPLDTDDGA